MKESLRSNHHKDKIVHFSIASNDLKKIEWEDEHEFRLNGEMYDVIEMHKTGDTLSISCISDKDENILLQQYRTNEGGKPDTKNRTIALLKIISNIFEPVEQISIAEITINRIVHFPLYNLSLLTSDLSIITPPPQLA